MIGDERFTKQREQGQRRVSWRSGRNRLLNTCPSIHGGASQPDHRCSPAQRILQRHCIHHSSIPIANTVITRKERKLVVLFVSQGFESSWSAKLLVWARGNTTHHDGGMWPAKLLIFWPSCKGEGRGCNPVKGLHAVTSLLIGFSQ